MSLFFRESSDKIYRLGLVGEWMLANLVTSEVMPDVPWSRIDSRL